MSRIRFPAGGTNRAVLLALLLVGVAVRVIPYLAHPTDQRTLSPWREADYTQIARSFHREGGSILYPRVDWRGDTAGFVEMELPILPWLASVLYRSFGYHEQFLRLLAALAGIATLVALAKLAFRVLPSAGALFAIAALAVNGLHVHLSSSIQPESLQLLLCVLAVERLERWRHGEHPGQLMLAAAVVAGAILVKSPAAYLGLLFGYVVLRKRGVRALTDPWTWGATLTAVGPPAAWLLWAGSFYRQTGLSLGLSNETHLLSWEVLRHPMAAILGNVRAEVLEVFGVVGVIFALGAFLLPWKKIELAAVWYLSVVLFYVFAADTSGDAWATYYHANSIAPACLLMGFGLEGMLAGSGRARSRLAWLLAGITLAGLIARGAVLTADRFDQPRLERLLRCSREFAQQVPTESRIVVRGGSGVDWHGHPVAYHEPMIFTWMDRQGFVIAREDLEIAKLEELARRGGRYWFAKAEDVLLLGEGELGNRFGLLASCDGYKLYDLDRTARIRPPEPSASSAFLSEQAER